MANETEPRAPWDEAAALEELERVRREIEEWRRRRKAVQAEFDRFVQGFRTSAREAPMVEPPPPVAGTDSPATRPRTPTAASNGPLIVAPPPEGVISATVLDVDVDDHVTAPAPSVLEPTAAPSAPLPAPVNAPSANYRIGRRPLLVFVGVLLAIAVAAALLTRPWQGAPSGSARVPLTPSARQTPQPAAPPDSQRATPAEAGPARSEILAIRKVWVRVVVDGVKSAERELQAGERVPLPAGSTAAIRAGNAGAVQVTINGENRGTLGAEGEVVTRTVRIPAPPVR